ncbi:MAG: sugar 3,4-ketoisomerase [Anaerovoracaceae bacterium]
MDIQLTNFRQVSDDSGSLIAIEQCNDIPFEIKRVYYIFNVGEGVRRGYHAHKKLEQYLICIHGSCSILLDNGTEQKTFLLDNPAIGLYVGPGTWREMYDFSQGAVLLVLASEYFDENDYIRDYDTFLNFLKEEDR